MTSSEPNDIQLVKADEYRQIIYGVALEPLTVDSQGDVVRAPEIEKAAHQYLAKAVRGLNAVHRIQHGAAGFSRERPSIVPVESYIAPADFQFEPGGEVIQKGSWVLVAKVEDPALWQSILDGKFTGWSVGGSGLRTPLPNVVAKVEDKPVVEKAIPATVTLPAIHLHIDKDAVNVAPPAVTVHNHIPAEAEHHIHVAPSVAAAPVVNVAVEPTPIEAHNHVTVEAQRKPTSLQARMKKDGTREYTPVYDDAA